MIILARTNDIEKELLLFSFHIIRVEKLIIKE
jgi:hypothetical protein